MGDRRLQALMRGLILSVPLRTIEEAIRQAEHAVGRELEESLAPLDLLAVSLAADVPHPPEDPR